jgi:uncharacterized protein YecT (DUF1311 family)
MIAFFGLLFAAASAPHDPRCDSVTTPDLVACAQADEARADSALNVAWKTALAEAKGWESGIDAAGRAANGNVTYSQALLASQRAWLSYRDAQCKLEIYANAGGHELPIYRLGCLSELTKARTTQLQDFAGGH